MTKIRENADLILIVAFIMLTVIGATFAQAILIYIAIFLAIISSFLSKSPFTNSKEADERELYIISKSSQNAYKIMFIIICLWYMFSFEKNVFNSLNLAIKDSVRLIFALLYLSYNGSYSYYKRKH
jgi:Na+-transporting methylmalonyl-CoA/oxaloacetate decarboxylase gamma subunit